MIVLSKHENIIKVKPQSVEDLWHLEKIIKKNDLVGAHSVRKFTSDGGSTEKKPVFIKLDVEKVSFHEASNSLKILGVIVDGNPIEYITIKSHHSFEITPNEVLSIEKKKWMHYELDRLKEAQAETQKTKLSMLILDEREAELFALQDFGVKELGKIQTMNRGKYSDETKEVKNKFYSEILELIKNIKTQIIIAGPGFERDNFANFLKDKNFKNFIVTSCQNTGKQGVYELIETKKVDRLLENSRIATENALIEEFVRRISTTGKATYGPEQVKKAIAEARVDKLLVLDNLLFEKKEEIEKLLDSAEATGSKIHLISHENELSEKIKAFGGIVALLRY